MKRIKESAVSNSFYTGDTELLKKQIESFDNSNNSAYEYKTRAVIVPHAGYIYSGDLAFEGINQMDRNIKNIFIFAPAHRVFFEGLALSSYDEWETPLGKIEVNQEINNKLIEKYNAQINDGAHKDEHSIEVQVPIIQYLFNEIKIIPVLIGKESPEIITKIISDYYDNKDFGFIISSDLSHYLSNENAKRLDNETAKMIETGDINGFRYEQACGAVGVFALVQFANSLGYSLIRINMKNSSATTGDKSRVVGYGCWLLYEGNKNNFIKEYYSEYLLNLSRDIISSRFDKKTIYTNHKQVFNQLGACFVTLKKKGHLRGCIGSIIAHQSLINDFIAHSQDAAFRDPRFIPVEKNEINDLVIDISLLSSPTRIIFEDESDLLNKIIPYKDGIIIRDKDKQAVYLPSVWEELPDKTQFLQSLKIKAGMSPEHFSSTFEAFRFETVFIEQHK